MTSFAGRARGFSGLARNVRVRHTDLRWEVNAGTVVLVLLAYPCLREWMGEVLLNGRKIDTMTECEILATRLHYGIPSEPEMRDYSGINAAVTSGFHGPAKLYAGEGLKLRWHVRAGSELLVIRKPQPLGEWYGWVIPTSHDSERKPLTEFEVMAVRLHYGIPEKPELEDYPDPYE